MLELHLTIGGNRIVLPQWLSQQFHEALIDAFDGPHTQYNNFARHHLDWLAKWALSHVTSEHFATVRDAHGYSEVISNDFGPEIGPQEFIEAMLKVAVLRDKVLNLIMESVSAEHGTGKPENVALRTFVYNLLDYLETRGIPDPGFRYYLAHYLVTQEK